jgi:hypothetical protein
MAVPVPIRPRIRRQECRPDTIGRRSGAHDDLVSAMTPRGLPRQRVAEAGLAENKPEVKRNKFSRYWNRRMCIHFFDLQ